jgi:hypothetical protein
MTPIWKPPARWPRRLVAALAVLIAALLFWYLYRRWPPGSATDFWMIAAAFWGMITGVGTLGLVYVAWRGLRSLGLQRSGLLTQAVRDARTSAIHRCEEFANQIIPLNAPILNALSQAKIPVFVMSEANVKLNPDNVGELPRARVWLGALPEGLYNQAIGMLNRLEAWSMYFTHELADARVAYGPCAPFFVSIVVQLYPVLLVQRNLDATSGKYPNIVELFSLWLAELDQEKLGLKEGQLLQEIAELQRRGSRGTKLPTPLGTQLDD